MVGVFLRTPVSAYDKLYYTTLCDEKQNKKDLNMMLWYHVGSITILRTPGVCNITQDVVTKPGTINMAISFRIHMCTLDLCVQTSSYFDFKILKSTHLFSQRFTE